MENVRSLLAVTIASLVMLAVPVTTHAYLSPEQVFGGQTQDLQPAPMTQREGEAAIAERQQRTADWRSSAQASLAPVDAEPQDTFVPEAPKAPNLLDETTQYNLRMQRIQDAKNAQGSPSIVIAGNGTVIDSKGNVLHSGAPLVTSTGPGTVLALIILVLAGMCTYGYVTLSARRFSSMA